MKTKLLSVASMAVAMLVAVLAFPVLAIESGIVKVTDEVAPVAQGLIAWTYAQTLTLSEMTTEVGTITTSNVPSLAIFIAFFVVVAAAAFLVGRLLRAGKA